MEIKKIIENTKNVYMSESSLETLMDFERVLDEVDMYAFKNWKRGELVEGPIKHKHWVECTFMYPNKMMPDPDGGKRLLGYNAIVEYKKDKLETPVKVEEYSDFRPGTRKPKMQEEPVWLVKIRLPAELVKNTEEGFVELEGREIDLSELDQAYEQNLDDVSQTQDAQMAPAPPQQPMVPGA